MANTSSSSSLTQRKIGANVAELIKIRQRGDPSAFNTVNELNRHPRDHRITFYEPTHKYTLDGSIQFPTSVTGFIALFVSPFDGPKLLGNMFCRAPPGQSATWKMPYSKSATASNKYAGMTIYDAALKWDQANKDGTALHACIEHYFNCIGTRKTEEVSMQERWKYITSAPAYVDSVNRIPCEQFLKADTYLNSLGWRIYRYEWNIFSSKYFLCGGVDAVYKRQSEASGEDEYCVVDWKRSDGDFKKNYQPKWNKFAFFPMQDFTNTTFTKYQMQVVTYIILLSEYGISPKYSFLFQFNPAFVSYVIHTIPVVKKEVTHALEVWTKYREFELEIKKFSTGEGVAGLTAGVPLTRSSLIHPEYATPVYKSTPSTRKRPLIATAKVDKRQRRT